MPYTAETLPELEAMLANGELTVQEFSNRVANLPPSNDNYQYHSQDAYTGQVDWQGNPVPDYYTDWDSSVNYWEGFDQPQRGGRASVFTPSVGYMNTDPSENYYNELTNLPQTQDTPWPIPGMGSGPSIVIPLPPIGAGGGGSQPNTPPPPPDPKPVDPPMPPVPPGNPEPADISVDVWEDLKKNDPGGDAKVDNPWILPAAVGGIAATGATLGVTQPRSPGMETNLTPYPTHEGGTVGGGGAGNSGGATVGGQPTDVWDIGTVFKVDSKIPPPDPTPTTSAERQTVPTRRRGGPTLSPRFPSGRGDTGTGTAQEPDSTSGGAPTPTPAIPKPSTSSTPGAAMLPKSNIGIHQHQYDLPDSGPVQGALAEADTTGGNELIIAGEGGKPELVYGKGVVIPMDRMKNKLPFPVRGLANGGPFGRIGRGLQQAGQWLVNSGPAPTSPLTPGFNGQMPPVRPPMSVPANAQTPGFNPNANTPQVGNPGVMGAASTPMSRNIPPPSQAQPTGSAQDAYKAALSISAPQPRTSPLQRIAAMGAAGMGGLVNASGRARISPEVIRGAAMNIKHPNFPGRMREYQGGIDRAKAAADAERQAAADEMARRQAESGMAREAAATQRDTAYASKLGQPEASVLDGRKLIAAELEKVGNPLTPEETKMFYAEGKLPPRAQEQAKLIWDRQVNQTTGDVLERGLDPTTGDVKVERSLPGVRGVPKPVPGRDVPLPESVARQKREIAQGAYGMDSGTASEITPLPSNWKPGDLNENALAKYPEAIQQRARQLVEYKIPFPTGRASTIEPWASAIKAASELDPTWTASNYNTRLSTWRSFTSGRDAHNKTAINTVIRHLKTLNDSAEALDNTDVQTVNKVKNRLAEEFGDPSIENFNMAARAVYSELAAVFKGTGASPTDQEMKEWHSSINTAKTPEQMKAVIEQATELVAGRLAALKDKFETGMGKPMDFAVLSPESRARLEEIGIDPNSIEYTDQGQTEQQPSSGQATLTENQFTVSAGGKTYVFPTQEQANAFKREAGIQ